MAYFHLATSGSFPADRLPARDRSWLRTVDAVPTAPVHFLHRRGFGA